MIVKTPQEWGLPATRVCKVCGIPWPLTADHYSIDKRRYPWASAYFRPICKPCDSARSMARRNLPGNRERYNANARAWRARQKARATGTLSQGGVSADLQARLDSARAARESEAERKRLAKATLKHLYRLSPTYRPPRKLFGKWRGMTQAECTAAIKAAASESEAHVPDAEEVAHRAALLRLIEENRAKYGDERKPFVAPFGVIQSP